VGLIQAVVLGLTQGITEFLPVSSDGHLALVYRALGQKPNLAFEILLHAATLAAMIVYFRSDIARLLSSLLPSGRERKADRRLVGLILVATAVSGAVALALSPIVEPMSGSMAWVGTWFLVTAAVLALAEGLASRVRPLAEADRLPWWKAVFIGLMQGSAALPAISRSGTTIAGGMLSGLDRERAARFSFLLGIPIIALAAAKDALDIASGSVALPPILPAAIGFIVAAVSGYLAIWGLLGFVKNHRLWPFAAYTALLGTAILVMTVVR
jgi:undecaprenyl-diphosphatase